MVITIPEKVMLEYQMNGFVFCGDFIICPPDATQDDVDILEGYGYELHADLVILQKDSHHEARNSWENIPYPEQEEILELVIEDIDSLEADGWIRILTEFCTYAQKDLEYGRERLTKEEIKELKEQREQYKRELSELRINEISSLKKEMESEEHKDAEPIDLYDFRYSDPDIE